MNVDQVKARIARAQQRIHQELSDLSADLGTGFELDVGVDWLSVGTHESPYEAIPHVQVSARLRP